MDQRLQGRVQALGDAPVHTGGRAVVYWMQNSQRASDNPALDVAVELANERGVGVVVYFALDDSTPHATSRTFTFLIDGLRETVVALRKRRIGTLLRVEPAVRGIVALARELDACAVVTDLSPLRRGRGLRDEAARKLDVPLLVVDGDHVVPLTLIGREHWAARTIRPVIHRLVPEWLYEPEDNRPKHRSPELDDLGETVDLDAVSTDDLLKRLGVDRTVPPAEDAEPGPRAAQRRLDHLLQSVLPGYSDHRRSVDGAGSGLSPYLRFGQISPLRVAWAVHSSKAPEEDRSTFLEELVVRRELSSNFVFYNPAYDRLDGLPEWARKTLANHARDPRPFVYDRDALAAADTHDTIWNAAQRELLARGRIHNHVRMYWGKKVIEWTSTPADALAAALWLNDRFGLDGRSANGFTNVQWCFGKHDRAWAERPVFGTVRWMSDRGMAAKFDLKAYLARWGNAPALL